MARVRGHQFDYLRKRKIHHIGIEVANMKESLHLFRDVLSFTILEQFQFAGERIAFLKKNDTQIELVQVQEHLVESSAFHIAVLVDDLEEPMTLYKNSGVWEEPVTYPNGWTSAFMKIDNHLYIEWLKTSASPPVVLGRLKI